MTTEEHDTVQGLRRVFVGRGAELGQLTQAFNQASQGHGSLAVVVGEPGIGKTTLTEHLAAHVAEHGGETLIGHCYEEGSLSLAYLPFVEALRTHVLAVDEAALREELGTAAGYIARIVPETRDRLAIEPAPATDPDEDRFRLMQSVGDVLGRVGANKPLLVVLEDLHDSDTATIDLLKYLSRRLDGMRVLVVGTYRDVEVDRAHPLSSAIAELRRSQSFARVPLRGLTVEEVGRMISSMSGQEVRNSLAEAVHRQTEGNPLFVQEVLRYFVEQGYVKREGDKWVGQWRTGDGELPESAIPEGLRDVIGQRLTKLSAECNRVLAIAAVIGRDFTLEVLGQVSGEDDDALISALDEARAAGIVEERAAAGGNVTYRFAHAFFRQTLYEETGAARRIRIHQQVGRAIELVHARRLDAHAAELAEHFAHSSNDEDLEKSVTYGEQAARQAIEVYGYGEAARLLERALDVQDILDPDDKERKCDLMLLLSEAIVAVVDPASAQTTVPEQAFRLAEEIGDSVRASAAAQLALTALTSGNYDAMREWIVLAERHDATHADQARTRSMRAMTLRDEKLRAESRAARREAWDLALGSGNADIAVATANTYLMLPTSPMLEQTKLGVAETALGLLADGVSIRRQGFIYWNASLELLAWGDRTRSEYYWGLLRQLANRTGHSVAANCLARVDYAFALLEGRFDDALALNDWMLNLGGNWEAFEVVARQHLGVRTPAEDFERVFGGADYLGGLNRLFAKARDGRTKEARSELDSVFAEVSLLSSDGALDTDELGLLLQAALLLSDRNVVAHLADQLIGHPHLIVHRWAGLSSIGRIVGDAMAFLGRPDEARGAFRKGLEVCEKIRFRPEIALIRLGQAELIADHYPGEVGDARGYLDFAINELTEMKMAPALQRAMALQERLDAEPVKTPEYPDGLTARQVEVLCLLAKGRTDKEIAEELVLSLRGASNHVANIFKKIDVANRAEAAAYAVRHGLCEDA